jgi:TonB family protein
MKQCPTCQEEFADKFGFCPVDGTPLDGHVAAPEASAARQVGEEPSVVTVASTATPAGSTADSSNGHGHAEEIPPSESAAAAGDGREEYHLTMLEDVGITRRLAQQTRDFTRQTWPEFKRDPVGTSQRTAVAVGQATRRFFKQDYTTAAVISGVLVMILTLGILVFPYGAVYKWFTSDGKLVANVGMPLEEVQKNSTLRLAEPNGQADSSGATAISAENVDFDFELAGTGLKFEWSRSYMLQLDENRNVSKISIEVAQRNETWRELRLNMLDIAEWLDVKGWRSISDDDGRSSVAYLNAAFEQSAPREGSVGEFRWMNEDKGLVLTLSAVRETAAGEGEDPSVAAQFVHFITVEKVPDAGQLELVTIIPKEQPTPDPGPAGTNKGTGGGSKPKPEKPGGGGGGGREDPLPVSHGKVAPASMNPQIMPPSVRVPAIAQPKLPVAATLKGDPLLLPEDTRPIPFGDPKSTSTIPSDGPGKGGGQGTGTGTGQGPGDGAGYGPGRGENVGGGDARYGGGGPGGGGGGAPPVDYNRVFNPKDVTSKAVIISKPDPGFTEEARKNNVTGVVRLRAVLSAGGAVTNIGVVKGLPDGLTERAIAAARNIKFRPAQKDGRNVSQHITLEYNFNIY